jgi:adenosylcobyric acid synthase
MSLRGAVMICGTASDVGKSRVVAGLCRVLSREHVRVAPFKAQNMALNSFVTKSGHEIARSQAHQAAAAGIAPEVEMNPVLLKPSGEMTSQLVVMGRPAGEMRAGDYGTSRPALFATVTAALDELRARYDVVVVEGAGGAAEINLLEGDLVNLPLARRAGVPAVLVGDIERGGVFASLYGTVALLPEELRAQLKGFLVNKLRGESRLLDPGLAELERRCGLPCLGVLPHLGELVIDAEDSLALEGRTRREALQPGGDVLDVAVIRLPHLANFTDFDPLAFEPGVGLRYVTHPGALGDPDLIVLPGSKATVADLGWLRECEFDRAITAARQRDSTLLGICAGYQMLGTTIVDEVESRAGKVSGLGLLESETIFHAEKCTRQRSGTDGAGNDVVGYEIRHGQPVPLGNHSSWFALKDGAGIEREGIADQNAGIWATSLHGIFECDGHRRSFLGAVAERRAKRSSASPVSFEAHRQAEIDRVADALEAHLDLDAVRAIIAEGVLR